MLNDEWVPPFILHQYLESPMDKKTKKKLDSLNQRIQRLRQQLAGAKKQRDDSGEAASLAEQIAAAETDLARLKAGQS
jgi:DNA-binding FrmR family transcriptional regulator